MRIIRDKEFFLVPKPRLRAVSRHGKPGSLPGKCVPKPGLGNEKDIRSAKIEHSDFLHFSSFPSPCLGTHLRPLRSVSRHGKPGRCVPKPGLGNEKDEKKAWEREKNLQIIIV